MLPWIAVSVVAIVALAVDLRRADDGSDSLRSALFWSVAWTVLGVAVALPILWLQGSGAATEYVTGFLVEKSLSLDNVFVFGALFAYFSVPAEQRRRVLVYGVAGAVVLRTVFIVVGAAAFNSIAATTYVLGVLLLLTAVRMVRGSIESVDPEHTIAMRLLKRVVPITHEYAGARFITTIGGHKVATPLLAALAMVAAFDVMFAIDSIPAVLAITHDTFIVFAANAFSLLGMVSLFFLLEGLAPRVRFLDTGLAAILAFVAVKLLLADVWHPPTVLSLAVVVFVLAVVTVASIVADRLAAKRVATPGPG